MDQPTTPTPQAPVQSGLDKKTAAALTYVLGPITGVAFFLIEKDNRVRFHAVQSTIVFGALWIVSILLSRVSFLLSLINFGGFILWLVLIYKTWEGEDLEIPYVSEYTRKFTSYTPKK